MTTQNKNTQGPWIFNGESVLDSKGSNVCTKANAHLIAAAPEMLAALYSAIAYVEDALNDPAFKPGVVAKHAKQIRDAIAKAEAAQIVKETT